MIKQINIKPLIFLFLLANCIEKPKNNMLDLDEYTIEMLQKGYSDKLFTVTEVVTYYLNKIDSIDKSGPELNSIISVNPDAIVIAKKLDKKLSYEKNIYPLFGIPVIIKDNINTNDGMPTTAGSRILKDSYPSEDSWISNKLRQKGAIILGKANLSEWANYRASVSSSGWSGILGQTKNPYVLDRNPCGSSSGSAVAVASNLCAVSIGTETWGSIICPSNVNGIVGIKPTVGLWSRTGIIPISYNHDTAGPMARNVSDAARLLGALIDTDLNDPKTYDSKRKSFSDYTQFLKIKGLEGKRIGYLNTEKGKNFKIDSLVEKALQFMKEAGATIIILDKIVEDAQFEDAQTVLAYEFKDGLNKYLKRLDKNGIAKNLKEIIKTTYADSIEMEYFDVALMEDAQSKGPIEDVLYKKALEKLHKNYRDNGIDAVMNKFNLDAIIAPSGGPAWKTDLINGDNFQFSTSSYAALSGYPSINVPMGFVDNLPVGLSFFGRAWSESILLEIAFAYEQGTNHRRKPMFFPTD